MASDPSGGAVAVRLGLRLDKGRFYPEFARRVRVEDASGGDVGTRVPGPEPSHLELGQETTYVVRFVVPAGTRVAAVRFDDRYPLKSRHPTWTIPG